MREQAAARPGLSLVVPVFNEETRVVESGAELARFVSDCGPESELIFVDDGSTDGTAAVVEELARQTRVPVRLLRRPHFGKGAAVQAGLESARAAYAGFTDIDLSTPTDQLAAVFKAAQMAPVVAVGSRDVPASVLLRQQHWRRELLGKTYNRLVQLTVVPGVADTQCGAKVAHITVWKAVLPWCREKGFAWDVEALAVARRLDVPVREVAIEWRNDERSSVRIARDGVDMILALPRIWRRARGVPSARGASGVFADAQAATLLESDSQHWWFHSKAVLASSMLRRHLPAGLRDARLLDVGAGAGGVTAAMGWRSDRVCAVEGSETLCRYGRDRHTLFTVVGLAERLPLRDRSVGVVTALDVIEHFERPELVLGEARRVLQDDGLLVVNVPAHEWLWSGADELLGHVCRYTRPILRAQLESAGFEVLYMSHIFSWLVTPVWLQRRLTRDPRRQLGLQATSPVIDRVAMILTAVEREVVRHVPLPFGTSILCVMAKAADR